MQSSPTLLSATGLAREYLLQEEAGQRHDVETEDKRSIQLGSHSQGGHTHYYAIIVFALVSPARLPRKVLELCKSLLEKQLPLGWHQPSAFSFSQYGVLISQTPLS